MKDALEESFRGMNGFTGFVTVYGIILWIGFGVTGNFWWFTSIFEGETSAEAGIIAGIVGFLSFGGYLYGAFAIPVFLINLFKSKGNQR